MIKRMVMFSLPEGTDPDEFWRYWQEGHVPDVLKLPGLKRYTINRVAKVITGEARFWGFAETWWDSEQAMYRAFSSPLGKSCNEDFFGRVVGILAAILEEKVNL
jgi:uncharacterized protein (TIGR02118 family)